MIGRSPGVRKLCVAYDVENYSSRGTRREFAIQARLAELLQFAFTEAGSAPETEEIQEQGDGGIAFLPTGGSVDEPRLLVGLINALRIGLAELNEDIVETAQLRVRVALHQGVIHRAAHGYVGPAVVEVCRLRDAEVVRAALAQAAAPLVVVVSDGLYRDVLGAGHHGLPASAFTQVDIEVKQFRAAGWLYVPAPVPGHQPAETRDQGPPGAGSAPGPTLDSFLAGKPDAW